MKTTDLFLFDAIPGTAPEKEKFASAVFMYSAKLGILPEWLMTAMHFESRLNSKAKNPNSSATGLIQFMDATARSLGTSTAALYQMPAVDQLYYVYKYLQPYAGKLKSLGDVYLAIFYPAAIGKASNYILPVNEKTVQINRVLDKNQDNKLSRGEIEAVIYSHFEALKKKFPYIGQTMAIISTLLIFAALIKLTT